MHQLILHQDSHQEPAEIPRTLIASSNGLLSKTLILGSHDASVGQIFPAINFVERERYDSRDALIDFILQIFPPRYEMAYVYGEF